MKLSRRIRRGMLRCVPEWCACFARSVTRLSKVAVKCGRRFARNKFINSSKKIAAMARRAITNHQREWATAPNPNM